MIMRRPTCPHCDVSYDNVKHIRERIVPIKEGKKIIIQAEIEKYCRHCENRWVHTYDATTFNNMWKNCTKECDCGFVEKHKKDCASKCYT